MYEKNLTIYFILSTHARTRRSWQFDSDARRPRVDDRERIAGALELAGRNRRNHAGEQQHSAQRSAEHAAVPLLNAAGLLQRAGAMRPVAAGYVLQRPGLFVCCVSAKSPFIGPLLARCFEIRSRTSSPHAGVVGNSAPVHARAGVRPNDRDYSRKHHGRRRLRFAGIHFGFCVCGGRLKSIRNTTSSTRTGIRAR